MSSVLRPGEQVGLEALQTSAGVIRDSAKLGEYARAGAQPVEFSGVPTPLSGIRPDANNPFANPPRCAGSMIYGLKWVFQYLTGRDRAGRTLAVLPDDTFVVSYPRSGNTWTRFLIANLLHPEEPATFANIERLVPDSEAQSSRYMRRISRPRVIKTHTYFDPRFPRVIYIVRDPRDVALSYYDFQRKYRQIDDQFPLARYVGDFVGGKLISKGWGTWGENVGSWIAAKAGSPGFLLLRYEDMIVNPEQELSRVAAFFGVEVSPERLASVAQLSSASRMRALEKTQGKDWVSTKNKRSDIPFVRAAVSGGWEENLPASCAAEIEAAWGPIMTSLNYKLSGPQNTLGADAGISLEFSSILDRGRESSQ